MRPLPAAALDVLIVLGFVLVGRRSHAEALDPAGTAATAAPFLLALAAGWLVARAAAGAGSGAARAELGSLRAGAVVWAVTLAGGMLLRALAGGGTDPAFVAVAAAVLATGLVGWRAVRAGWRAGVSARRRAVTGTGRSR